MIQLTLFILSILLVSTLIVNIKLRNNHSAEVIVNQQRIKAWWVIVLICLPLLYIGGYALTLLIFSLIYWIYFEITRLQNVQISMESIVVITLMIYGYNLLIQNNSSYTILFFAVPFFILAIILFVSFTHKIQTILLLFFCFTSIMSLQLLSKIGQSLGFESGVIILFLFIVTSLNDVAQYLSGRLFGHHLLAPILSPKKTVEGALGGMFITSLIFMLIIPDFIHISWVVTMLAGFLISILGIAGDLTFSSFKRQAGVKDSGRSIPGHGGLIDRIDSLTLTAPGFGFLLCLMN